MMGEDFASRAMAFMMLPLLAGVFVAGGLFFGLLFYAVPWLWNYVSIVVH
jgi:hypothetical protein